MLWPDRCPVCESVKPRSFAALMEMYEQNYLRIRCLGPDIGRMEGKSVSRLSNHLSLLLTVLEQTRHTTTIRLTYLMNNGETRPDVEIRIYHDARQAELLSRDCRISDDGCESSASGVQSALQSRWKLNRFLYKWLNYLHRQGHVFRITPDKC